MPHGIGFASVRVQRCPRFPELLSLLTCQRGSRSFEPSVIQGSLIFELTSSMEPSASKPIFEVLCTNSNFQYALNLKLLRGKPSILCESRTPQLGLTDWRRTKTRAVSLPHGQLARSSASRHGNLCATCVGRCGRCQSAAFEQSSAAWTACAAMIVPF